MKDLDRLFYPRAVAVIGSTAPGKLGYELVKQIVDGGYTPVYAVNPKAQGAAGAPGVSSVLHIPQPLDLAVVASPAATVAGVLEQCGQAGVTAAVVITAGFSEIGHASAEAELKRIAAKYPMRLVGPNCAGIVNTHCSLFASLETRPPAGDVAFITQSGALGGAVLSWAEEQGVGIGKFLSYGNRADLDEIDLLPYLAEDPHTRVAALYIESVADGRAFMQSVRAFTRRKPLVVIKSGRSQAGQRATLSHTGSMAGSDRVYEAALRACGAIRVESIEEMFDLCKAFASLPPLRGRRLAIVTNSGGPSVLATDRAESAGLQTPEPGAALLEALQGFLPPQCALRNPIDLTVEGTQDGYRRALSAMLASEYDAAIAMNIAPPYLDSMALANGVCAAARTSGKPIAANFMAGPAVAEAVAFLKEAGIPNFATGERAVAALGRMADYTAFLDQPQATQQQAPPQPSHPASPGMLEPQAMAWLSRNGLPILPFRWAAGLEEAVAACGEIGYPVVMKVVSPDILHKSEWGGVRLNLRDETAAREAYTALKQAAYGCDFRGVVVYPMVHAAHEVVLGLVRDPQFGPVVLFGLGGIYTEILADTALRVAPLDRAGAEEMIRSVRAYPILLGARRQPPVDLDALAETLMNFSRLMFANPGISEIDLNPVFVFSEGLAVGDVRVIFSS
jgi:acetyltransferase